MTLSGGAIILPKRLDTMTFEPDRRGSSLASAASYGDALGIELIDAKAEASASDTSVG